MTKAVPKVYRCINHHPSARSVLFCDEFISLEILAMRTNLSKAILSMIFSCKRSPSLASAEAISKGLGMHLETFLEALRERKKYYRKYGNVPCSQRHTENTLVPVQNTP